jgi:hypothetical protein
MGIATIDKAIHFKGKYEKLTSKREGTTREHSDEEVEEVALSLSRIRCARSIRSYR